MAFSEEMILNLLDIVAYTLLWMNFFLSVCSLWTKIWMLIILFKN